MKFGKVGPKSRLALRLSAEHKPFLTIYEGAVRSGKTVTSLFDFIQFVMSPIKGTFAIVTKSASTFRATILENLIGMLGTRRVQYNSSTNVLMVCGRTIFVYGAFNEKSLQKIRGTTFAGAYLDEIATYPRSFFDLLLTRMSEPGARVWGTCNPEHAKHWLLTDYLSLATVWVKLDGTVSVPKNVTKRMKEASVHRYTYNIDDNKHLAADVVERLKSMFTGVFYRRNILSEWVSAEGLVYDLWSEDEHVIEWGALPVMDEYICAGVDYGTTNASSCVLIGRSGSTLYAVDEFRHDSRADQPKWTNRQLSEAIVEWLELPHTPNGEDLDVPWTFVDPSATSLILQLQEDRCPYPLPATGGAGSVLEGIRIVASLLQSGNLKISDRCHGLRDEFAVHSWDPKATAMGEDKPLKIFDHSLDALRYSIYSSRSEWLPYIERSFSASAA